MKISITVEDISLDEVSKVLKIIDEFNKLESSSSYVMPELDLGVLAKRPQSEISKLKLFMEVFNGLSGQEKYDVEKENFFNELIQTGRFTLDQCNEMLNKALQNGQIYERRSGYYAKA